MIKNPSIIKETYTKAFFDLLAQSVAEEPPDYDWITSLYVEIRTRLLALLRSGTTLHRQIMESMDAELFNQMIRHEAFDGKELYNLICFVFDKCLQLCAPARDQETEEKKVETLTALTKEDSTFATVVPIFVRNANYCLDRIDDDIAELKKRIWASPGDASKG